MPSPRGIEKAPLKELKEIQNRRLRHLVKWAYEWTGLCRRKFDEVGVKPMDIQKVEDLRKVPLTQYFEDFLKTPLSDKLALPLEKVRKGELNSLRIHSKNSTTQLNASEYLHSLMIPSPV